MNNQEAFDKAVSGVLKQASKSFDFDHGCRYRGPNGLKCAVGHLIPDEIYKPEMEIGIASLYQENLEITMLFKDVSLPMLRALQRAHDNSSEISFVDDFKIKAFDIAAYYELNTDVLK